MTVSSTEQGAAPVEAAPDVTPADPSTAEPGAQSSLLDAVSAALKPEPEAPPTSAVGADTSAPTPTPTPSPVESAPETSDDLSEEDKRTPPQTQRRIQQLLGQRKELRGQLEQLKPRAEVAERLQGFMAQTGISQAEVNNVLEITRRIKVGDYERAREALKPIFDELNVRSGEVLPDDLRQKIRLGHITEADARDLHKARTKAKLAEDQTERSRKQVEEQERSRQQDAAIQGGVQALDAWAAAKAQSDPDWNRKQALVVPEFELLIRRASPRGQIPSGKDVVRLAEQALQTVEARLKDFAPKPEVKRTPTGQFASPRSVSTPTSHVDAVRQALRAGS